MLSINEILKPLNEVLEQIKYHTLKIRVCNTLKKSC